MTTLIDLLSTPPNTATRRGLSYWKEVVRCGRAAQLKILNQEASTGNAGTAVGSICHLLCELYHGRELSPKFSEGVLDVTPDSGAGNAELDEALRVFEAYRKQCTPGEWGTPLAVEHQLTGSIAGADVTGALDLLVEVSEADADRILAQWNLFLLPGKYVVDYKFRAARYESSCLEDEQGLQFKVYPALCAQMGIEVLGTIVVRVYKYKSTKTNPTGPKVEPVFVAPPTPEEMPAIEQWFALAQKKEKEELGIANLSACFSGISVCHWYKNGLCGRK